MIETEALWVIQCHCSPVLATKSHLGTFHQKYITGYKSPFYWSTVINEHLTKKHVADARFNFWHWEASISMRRLPRVWFNAMPCCGRLTYCRVYHGWINKALDRELTRSLATKNTVWVFPLLTVNRKISGTTILVSCYRAQCYIYELGHRSTQSNTTWCVCPNPSTAIHNKITHNLVSYIICTNILNMFLFFFPIQVQGIFWFCKSIHDFLIVNPNEENENAW